MTNQTPAVDAVPTAPLPPAQWDRAPPRPRCR